MNPKILKFRAELKKNRGKISDLQARNTDLENMILELENTDIIGMVRDTGMTIEQFIELFDQMKKAPADYTKEDIRHEEV